ncbi:pyridoxamine 5'-phosphate oxidase family protein [Paractinoplanes durhamensis]|uniref:Pyridoxamine 5'-phosphate oxidase N-terminal domain-containing protein n=1 Tax=Paractinoplanes durhamensis TaxID=113563 RepID=A0ABQ3YT02_9ACTN|nr:pyridoxamine 5'-phosphate oxidase family protein [Actinoplanes durhamensis]GIE00706.1 hypothetical protein Adu01nite_20560 [Actinoplanes durhamensis]
MDQAYQVIDGRLRDLLLAQPVFFVGTLPDGPGGQIDLAPHAAAGGLAVLDDQRIAYLSDGSDAEMVEHLRANGRITLLCAVRDSSRVVRLQGRGQVVDPGDPGFGQLMTLFPDAPAGDRRPVVEVTVEQVNESSEPEPAAPAVYPPPVEPPDRWIFRIPILRVIRNQHEDCVRRYDRDLLAYFDATHRIDDAERTEARPAVIRSLHPIDVRQAWLELMWRIKPSLVWTAVWPAPWIYGFGAWLLAWSPAAGEGKAIWLAGALAYLHWYMAAVFCGGKFQESVIVSASDIRIPRYCQVLGAVLFVAGLALAPSTLSVGALLPAMGAILIAAALTFLVALLVATTVNWIPRFRPRAAIYMTEVALLSLAASGPRPDWPQWLVRGLWTGLWASCAFAASLVIMLIAVFLATSLYVRWKNRRYAAAELLQTLLWLVMRIDDAGRPEADRSELSRRYQPPDPLRIAVALEYLATVIEESLPKALDCGDRSGTRAISEHCRGIAASVRALKTERLLDQRTSSDALAAALANAIVPVALGDWKSLAYVEPADLPQTVSAWTRTLRWIGRLVAAAMPLAVILFLQATTHGSDKQLEPLVPVAATWLLVSIVTWIDPGGGDRSAGVRNLLGAVPGVKAN